jgi:hypothetical protein
MAFRFRRAYKTLLPAWLSTGEGEFVGYSLGLLCDAFAERMRLGLLARFPQFAPPDALSYLGRDRRIVRGINEPDDAYAARLVRYLDDHRVQGNPYALMDQLAAYCQAEVRIRTVDRSGNWFTRDRDGTLSALINQANWDWDGGAASSWSRFWVIIYPTADGQPWAASVGGSPASWPVGGTIGTTATPDQVASVRSIIREWQPDGTRCEWVIVAFDDASFDPTAPEPDGTWANFGTDNAGAYEIARLTTARYWKGVSAT